MDEENSVVKDPFADRDAELYDNLVRVGDELNLTRVDPTLTRLGVGVGWDLIGFQATEVDIDISAFFLNVNNTTEKDEDFIFYNNARAFDGAVTHNGDNRTGAGDGDDESMSFLLTGIPFTVTRIAFAITIYKSYEREMNLSMVRNLYFRIFNEETELELTRFLLSKELIDCEAGGAVVGYLDREGPEWFFRPQLDLAHKGLGEIATQYGIMVGQE
jgi:tellurium resistance protein TerD